MITMNELLTYGTRLEDQPVQTQANLHILLERINAIRFAYGKPMTVTSGLRDMVNHLRIYAAKGITDPKKIPMKSKHLTGEAVDIADGSGDLKRWVRAHVGLLEQVGLWCEAFEACPTWIHMQICPPASGKRFFTP